MRAYIEVLLACTVALGASSAGAADEVQRQLQQREAQQMELRLKMQQQVDRAVQPPQSPAAVTQQRQLERDQLQRLQQAQDREMRGTIAPAPESSGQQAEIERRRAAQAAAEQLNRFGAERR
jgi:hypothetical protein